MNSKPFDIAGKDWLTVDESAHYCGVSLRQFKERASDYRLQPRKFMGRKLYSKAELYLAIESAPGWYPDTHAAPHAPIPGSLAERLRPIRRRPFKARKKAQPTAHPAEHV